MTAPLRIGILGAARIVPNALIRPAARQREAAAVTAIAARDRTRAAAFAAKHGIANVHRSYDEVIADAEIDAIYNPLPNHLHHKWTILALRAGKHVLCEKPFAANAAEAEEMAQVGKQSGLVLMEAFHYRYHPFALRMKQIVESGALGEIRRIESYFCVPMLRRNDIRMRYDLAGGTMMDLGCYCVNLVRYLAGGEPQVVAAVAARASDEIDRAMEVEMAFPGGPSARVVCSFNYWRRLFKIETRVLGSRGELHALNPFLPMLFNRLTVRTQAGTRREHIQGNSTYDYQLRAFVDAVRTGAPFATTAEDAVANMRILDAIYRKAGLRLRGT